MNDDEFFSAANADKSRRDMLKSCNHRCRCVISQEFRGDVIRADLRANGWSEDDIKGYLIGWRKVK